MPMHDHLRDPKKIPLDDPKVPEGTSRQTLGPIPNGVMSRFHSCFFMFRDEENYNPTPVIEIENDGRCKIDLVGYVIIPSEVYNKYVDMAEKLALIESNRLMGDLLRKPKSVEPDNSILGYIRKIFKRNR